MMSNNNNNVDLKETELSLLDYKPKCKPKQKQTLRRRILRIWCLATCLCVVIIFMLILSLVLYHADFAKSGRCLISDALRLDRFECIPPATLG